MYSVIDKAHSEKVWFSKFRYEKSELLWKDEYVYIPYLSRMINFVVRKLLNIRRWISKKRLNWSMRGRPSIC